MSLKRANELELDEKTHEVKLLCACGRNHVISQKEKDVVLTTDETGVENGQTPKNPSGNDEPEEAGKGFLNSFFQK
jgi:hypothetical protein